MPARNSTTVALSTSCLLAAALSAGCSGSNSSSAEQGEPTGSPALSQAQAQQVLASYTTAANQLERRLNGGVLPTFEADPQLTMDAAAVKFRRAVKQKPSKIEFSGSKFYIPRVNAYPHWFAASATVGQGQRAVRHAMLFTQAKQGAPWLLTAAPFQQDDPLAGVALDSEGLATPVAQDADGLAIAPKDLPKTHAALLTDGPNAPGAATLADGSKTSESYKALQQGQKTLSGRGVTMSSRFSTTPYSVYALRTKDQGAVVWYVLKQNEVYSASQPGKLTVGGDLVGLTQAKSARSRMDTTVLVQYLATVPQKGRANVTGMYRKAVAATVA